MSLVFRQIRKHLLLPALALCAQAAFASSGDTAPVVPAKVDAKALASSDSILRYCGKVSPESVPALERKRQALVHGTSQAELDKLRQTTPYLEASSAEENFLQLVDERNVNRVCPADPAAAKKKAQ